MLKKFFVVFIACVLLGCNYSKVSASNTNDLVISNGNFSFTMPAETKNTYIVKKMGKGIFICEKMSVKSNKGGFAFGLKLYKLPSEYAIMEDAKKIGELTDKDGELYDMVLISPREIYYGDGKTIQENYTRLYDYGKNAGESIKGVNGSTYYKNRGMKGEELYGEILKKYKTAITENWKSDKYVKEDLGGIYPTISKSSKKLLKKIGYIYYDINADGIDELIIGGISDGKLKGIIYDVYTMVDRKPMHILSAGKNEKFFVCDGNFLLSETTEKPNKKMEIVSNLEKNSIKMTPKVMFIYDPQISKENPWFVTYGLYGSLENVSEEEFNERKNLFNDYKKFNYLPLSE